MLSPAGMDTPDGLWREAKVLQVQLTRCSDIGAHKSLHLPKCQDSLQAHDAWPSWNSVGTEDPSSFRSETFRLVAGAD